MASLHNLSTRHAATREFDIFIDKVTITSFFSTLIGITLILLLTSLFFNGLTHSIPISIIRIKSDNYTAKGKSTNSAANQNQTSTNKNHKGTIGSKAVTELTKQDSTEHSTSPHGEGEHIADTPYNGTDGDNDPSNEIFSSQGTGTESTVENDDDEGDFTVIPDIEPRIEISAIHKNVVYPEMARKLGKEGEVVLRVLISEKGNVGKVEIVSSTSVIFEQSAIDALKNFSTNPAMSNGKPVPYAVYIPIKFRIR